MLADSAYIQEADVRFVNKRKRSRGKLEVEPLYTKEDVAKSLEQFVTVEYNSEKKLDDFVKLAFADNSHISGSATVNLKILSRINTVVISPMNSPEKHLIILFILNSNRSCK
ncbi:hypothetical protein N9R81_02130 [Flavobacteriales bacterium]|nr:hypothetical protein [Flavobacteriales bacterium]